MSPNGPRYEIPQNVADVVQRCEMIAASGSPAVAANRARRVYLVHAKAEAALRR